MWLFRKKTEPLPPEDVSEDGITARYNPSLKHWEFELDGIEFQISGLIFERAVFQWAREAINTIRRLKRQIDEKVTERLEGWPCNKTARKLLCVDLDKYPNSKTMDIAFVGDDSWGELGVNVIVTNGTIADAFCGD